MSPHPRWVSRRTFAALIELFAPLAPPEAARVRLEPVQQIAPALLRAYGAGRADATATAPLADIHIDLPAADQFLHRQLPRSRRKAERRDAETRRRRAYDAMPALENGLPVE